MLVKDHGLQYLLAATVLTGVLQIRPPLLGQRFLQNAVALAHVGVRHTGGDRALAQPVEEHAARFPLRLGARRILIGKLGEQRLLGVEALEWARTTLEAAGFEAPAALVPGDAERVIAQAVREQDIDLLVMGAYAHSPLTSLLRGSKTSDLLRSAKVPTLLLR